MYTFVNYIKAWDLEFSQWC